MTCASLAHATEQALATCKSGQPAILQVLTTFTMSNNDIHLGEKMAASLQDSGRRRVVKMMPWEPRMEWMARIQFIEDHIDKYGYDRALCLSNVGHLKFLHCRTARRKS